MTLRYTIKSPSGDGMDNQYTVPNVTFFDVDVTDKMTVKFTTEQGSTKTIVEQYNKIITISLQK